MDGAGRLEVFEPIGERHHAVDKVLSGGSAPSAGAPVKSPADLRTGGGEVLSGPATIGAPALGDVQIRDHFQNERGIAVRMDRTRDSRLTAFGKATLSDRYLMSGEGFQDLFARVAAYYADDSAHAQRLYDYMSQLWFM